MRKISSAIALGLLLVAGTSQGTIISGEVFDRDDPIKDAFDKGGVFELLELPFDPPFGEENEVGEDTFQSPNLYGFDEEQNVEFTGGIEVDLLAGESSGGTLTNDGSLEIASHYIFFDPVDARIKGEVTFDSDILALIWTKENLDGSDFLANTGVNYLSPNLRGFEPGFDSAVITGPRTVGVNFQASSPGDYFRVLTAFSPGAEEDPEDEGPTAVPEPGTLGLLGLGFVGIIAARRRLA